MPDEDCFEINRAGWDRRAEVHFRSKFYDVEGFLNGRTSLQEIELAELKSVAGRSLLHLQCHFGLDTLSWARLGAVCTGVDISPVAIDFANRLSDRSGLQADFVCSSLYDFNRGAGNPFDIVFTSYGTVTWLPDLAQWAEVVSANLVAGGTFYMVDFHPVYALLAGDAYFTGAAPVVEAEAGYTENSSGAVARFATWSHPFSGIMNALIGSGIDMLCLNEFPFSPYNCFAGMVEREPGRFYRQHRGHDIPLVYSLAGRKVT